MSRRAMMFQAVTTAPPANPTLLSQVEGGTGTVASLASGSISPATNGLLIACGGYRGDGGTITMSTTLANVGTWTLYSANEGVNSSAIIAVAKITGAPGTGTVTMNYSSGTASRTALIVAATTGHNSTPIARSASNTGTGTTIATTFAATPATNSLVVGAACGRAATNITPGTGFTELAEQTGGASGTINLEVQYDSANAAAVSNWGGMGGISASAVAIEIAAA